MAQNGRTSSKLTSIRAITDRGYRDPDELLTLARDAGLSLRKATEIRDALFGPAS